MIKEGEKRERRKTGESPHENREDKKRRFGG
jgi:hypothetical protein